MREDQGPGLPAATEVSCYKCLVRGEGALFFRRDSACIIRGEAAFAEANQPWTGM